MNYIKCIRSIVFLLGIIHSFQAQAGFITFHKRLQDSISVSGKDTVWTEVTPKTGAFKDAKVTDMITAGIDPFYPRYFNDSSVYRIYTTIKGYDASGSLTSTTTHTFVLISDPRSGKISRDKDIFIFNNAYKYKVTFTGGTKNGSAITSLPDYIYIDADIEVDRYYNFASYSTSSFTLNTQELDIDCDSAGIKDELDISWNTCFGSGSGLVCPEYYDLEWTFVNDYDSVAGSYKNPSLLNYDFRRNSTRISTSDNHYRISLLFEHGYLLFRVRGIGRDTANTDNYIVGNWSLAENGTVNSVSSANKHSITTAHETDLNWQYNSSYAEDGKKKEVVSYFDGSLRNRQAVTKMNSNKITMVGETIYDHEGRPAVNVLPVPVDMPVCSDTSESTLHFYPNFNLDDSSKVYSRNDFDVDDSLASCSITVGAMSTSSGASHYYSSSNPDLSDQQSFVPDAKKYPFTQVEYTPDNTGRIRRQGGVGINHQLNTGHETKYFYGQPSQIQLDRLFGSETGNAAHYKKNLVVDANGQISVTYLDQQGRTIATALAGDSAKGLIKLPSNKSTNPYVLTSDLFNKDAQGNSLLNTVNLQANAIEFNSQLLVSYPGYHSFTYTLSIDTMADSCLRNNICFNCIYDLAMHVYDDCGNDLAAAATGDTQLVKTIGHFGNDSLGNIVFNTTCNSPTSLNVLDTFRILLNTGNYTISKVLTVNQQAVDFYVNKYLDTTYNGCYKDLSWFQQQAMNDLDTSGCHIDCASCLERLGDRDSFVANGLGSYLEYDALADECQEPCKAQSDCYVRYLQMVSDMAPGGQYGEYLDNTGTSNPSAFPLSVFNSTNSLPKNMGGSDTADWHHPRIEINNHIYYYYVDDQGALSQITISKSGNNYLPTVIDTSSRWIKYDTATHSYYTFPSNLANLTDFISNWQYSWAKSLVVYHPEYCYYESCKGFGEKFSGENTTSDDFDALLRNTETFSQAVSAGLIRTNYLSLAYRNRIGDLDNVNDSLPYDPFLVHYPGYGSVLDTLLANYSPQPFGGYRFSMAEVASFYAVCGNYFGYADTAGCIGFGNSAIDSVKNAQWMQFVGLYLSNKQQLQQKYLDDIVKSSSCPGYSACFGDSSNAFSPATLASQYSNAMQPCGLFTQTLYSNKTRRYGGAGFFVSSNTNNANYQYYLQSGQCPRAAALQNLLGQLAFNGKLKSASNDSLRQYTSFNNDLYMALGGQSTYTNFMWNARNSGGVISANFTTATDTACQLVIDVTSSGLSSLNGYYLIGVTGLADTTFAPHTNAFRLFLALQDTITDTVTYKKALGYSSCFNINDCKFTDECQPNDFAADLQKLMSALSYHDSIGKSNVRLSQSMFSPYVSQHLRNALDTSTSVHLQWTYNNALKKFELYDSLNTSIKLLIDLGNDTAGIASSNSTRFTYISGFTSINSNYYNNFTIKAIDTINYNFNLSGSIIKRSIVSGDTTWEGISMGSCGYPTAFNCMGAPYKLQNDLQLLLHDILTRMPGNHNVDITKQPSFSNILANALPAGLDSSTSVLVTDTSGNGPYKAQLLFTLKANNDSCYLSLNADTLHAFDSIIDFYSLKGYGATDSYGNFHQFKGIVKYSISGSIVVDTLYGASCLPIQNCCACGSNDTVAVNQPYTPQDSCSMNFANYVDSIKAFNASAFAIAHHFRIDTALISYYDVTAFGYCNCLSTYVHYLDTYTASAEPQKINDSNYSPCPFNKTLTSEDKTCEEGYYDYMTAVGNFNHMIGDISASIPQIDPSKYTTFSFNKSGFCGCYQSYIAFINGILNHAIDPTTVDTSLLDIANYCNDSYTPPCQAYVAPDTGSITPGNGFPPAPKDTSCVQQAINIALENAQNQYNQYHDSLTTLIAAKYMSHCLGASEGFNDVYTDKEYHFTLYYYDQAGNLVRTIPPEGVHITNVSGPPSVPISVPATAEDSICWDRTYKQHLFTTDHTLPTTYMYNSLNQLVKQSMPDHDPIDVWEYTLPNGLHNGLKVTGMQLLDGNNGYLTGYIELPDTIKPGIARRGYLYKTTNAGKNWTQVPDLIGASLNKVKMVTAYTGYAVGKDGLVLKTIDKGLSWDIIPTYHKYTGLWGFAPEWKDLYFKDSVRGVIVGSQGKSLLIDLTQSNPANYIKPVSLDGDSTDLLTGVTYDNTHAYASAIDHNGFGHIYESNLDPFSTDSLRWVAVSGISSNSLTKVQFTPQTASSGFIAGVNGTLLHTRDAGAHWEQVSTGLATDMQSVFFRNDSVGIAIVDSAYGKSKLYKTSNGGRSWTALTINGKYYKALAGYPSSNSATKDKVFAVGKYGLVNRVIATSNNTAPVYGYSPYFGVGNLNSPTDKTDFNCVAVATYTSSGAKPRVVIGADNGKVYFCQKADSVIMVWDSVKLTTATPIKKIAMGLTGSSNDIQAVALDSNGVVYGINVATNDTSMITFGGTPPVFTDVVYNSSANKFYAYDNANHRLYYITFSGGLHPRISAFTVNTNVSTGSIGSIAFSGTSLLTVGKNGVIYKDSLVTTSPAWVDETTRLKLLPLTDIECDNYATPALYAVGYNGTLLQKAPSSNWSKIATPCNKNLNAIKFYSKNKGAMVGDNLKMYVLDINTSAGYTVATTAATTTLTGSNNLHDVVINSSNGSTYMVGDNGMVTTIGNISSGYTATRISMGANTQQLNGAALWFDGTLLAAGEGNSLLNRGTTTVFRVAQVYTQELAKAHFYNMADGFVIGQNGFIRHTSDGVNWQTVLPRLSGATLDSMLNVYTYLSGKAILLGKDTFMAKLSRTSTPVPVITGISGNPDFNDIGFGLNSPNMGYVVGSNKTVFKVSLPAFTITPMSLGSLPLPGSYDLHAVHVFLDNSIMAVGSKGAAVFYNAGNTNWYRYAFPNPPASADSTKYNFNDVYFHDDRNGYVVGDSGVAMRWYSSNNIQHITHNTTAASTYFIAKPTKDLLGVTDTTKINITCTAWPGRYDGLLGGAYYDSVNNARYARLVHDESQLFSTQFWYDALGRMVVSQNSRQYAKSPKAYSYTRYDALGRIVEVGEKAENSGSSDTKFANVFGKVISGFAYNIINNDSLASWLDHGNRTEVTHTYYDTAAVDSMPIVQENLRKRVSTVTYEDTDDGNPETYNHATHFSYDIHGNVKSLLQDNPGLATVGHRYKKIEYDYDLISGKVNDVYYQHDSLDAFTHHYEYDADNRITEVFTSRYPSAVWINCHNNLWDRDARYFYYHHGPLARVEYGNNHVQGIDYAYTLQGWIKAVNSEVLLPGFDMGKDGLKETGNANAHFARDAFGYSLTYYQGDYSAIGWSADSSQRFVASQHFAPGDPSDLKRYRNDLFNGNIGTMVSTLTNPGTRVPMAQASSYRYDQLNRLKEANSFQELLAGSNTWNNENYYNAWQSLAYSNKFEYDANGNIESQIRKDASGITFDSLTYRYVKDSQGRKTQNRLYHVNDTITAAMMSDDVDNEGVFNPALNTINTVNNYSYDKIGNLVKDSAEGIASIDWTVYGKIKSVTHRTGYKKINGSDTTYPPDLAFNYDASGNRICKLVKPRTNAGVKSSSYWKGTYYVRDAQGNVLSVYEKHDSTEISASYFTQTEKHLYGSSRIGIETTHTELLGARFSSDTTHHTLGNKSFELSNHLGNVLSTVSDKKIAEDPTHITTIYVNPDITRYGIDSAGGLQITPQSQYYGAGLGMTFASDSGSVYTIDFYYGRGNTDPLVDSAVMGQPISSAPGYSLSLLNASGHYSINVRAIDSSTWLKFAYWRPNSGHYHHFNIDSLTITKAGSSLDTISTYAADLRSVTDYAAFGAPLDGRTWQASNARFGFNGMEKNDEVSGAGNEYTTEFRQYDLRIGKWFSIDPKIKPWESSYASMGDNPIAYSDPNGDDLDVNPKDDKAKSDVTGLAKGKNQKYINIDDKGKVTLNFGSLSQKKIDKIVNRDKGLGLVKDLVEAKDPVGKAINFFYGTEGETNIGLENPSMQSNVQNYYSNISDMWSKGGTKSDEWGGYDAQAFILNASTQQYSSNGQPTSSGKSGYGLKPLDNYDAKVFIGRGTFKVFSVGNKPIRNDKGIVVDHQPYQTILQQSRSGIVYHELRESLLRTVHGECYKEAHEQAGGASGTSRYYPEETKPEIK